MRPLKHLSEQQLWQRWSARRDEDAAGELWWRYRRLAIAIAARILQGCAAPFEEGQDICDDCFLYALRTFQPDRGAVGTTRPFRSWFLLRVRSVTLDRRKHLLRVELGAVMPETGADAEPQLSGRIDLRELLPRLEAFVLQHYMPSDWAVLKQWMQHRSESAVVPWQALSRTHPITLDVTILFSPGSALVSLEGPTKIIHALNVCSRLQVRIVGYGTPDEPEALALQRAEAVRAAVEVGIRHRTSRGESRLSTEARSEVGPPRTEVEIVRGRYHTPDALRMRIVKVILPKAIKHIQHSSSGGA